MRVVFMGTPAFAVPSLSALVAAGHAVELVITQPDRPVGRKQTLTPPPVKVRAAELGLAVYQPRRVKSAESFEKLQGIAPDVIVVVGYGQIIPQRILDLPPARLHQRACFAAPEVSRRRADQLGDCQR